MIRKAIIQEAEILTKISFGSKGFWDYPKAVAPGPSLKMTKNRF